MGEERGVYRVLMEKPEGRRPLGRPRRRWVNIRMNLQEVGCGYMDWIGLTQDRNRWWTLVSAVMNLLVPWNVGNFLTSCKPVSFSRRTLHHGVSKCLWVTVTHITDQCEGHNFKWHKDSLMIARNTETCSRLCIYWVQISVRAGLVWRIQEARFCSGK